MPERPGKCVYVLHGPDDYLRRQHRREIVQALLPDGQTELAVVHLDASAELSEVLDELRTAPFLAPRRIVIITDADKFVTRHRAALEKYLAGPAPAGSLILIVNTWQPRWKLAALAARVGEVIDCSPPSPASLPRWIVRVAEARGKRISGDDAALLAAWVGNDLARLDGEIEKLALYVGSRRTITGEDLAAVVAAAAGPVAFALTNALAAGDPAAALAALDDLMTQPGEAYRVLGLIAWQLRKGRTPRARRSPRPGAGRKSLEGFRKLLAADLAIKTGAEPRTTMQLLVANLCA